MVANFPRGILFSLIIFLIGFQNIATANQNMSLSLLPSSANVGETTNFTIEIASPQSLSSMIIHFYVDAEEKGAKEVFNIEKNQEYNITFDYFFNENSYLGDHYIELKIDSITENQEKKSDDFYKAIYVDNKKKNVLPLFLLVFAITLIGSCIHFKYSNMSWIRFDHEDRKTLFSVMVTVLTISISIFTFTEPSELKIGVVSIFISLITSFISALFMIILGERWGETDANHFAFYSLCFLLLGLIEMVVLVF